MTDLGNETPIPADPNVHPGTVFADVALVATQIVAQAADRSIFDLVVLATAKGAIKTVTDQPPVVAMLVGVARDSESRMDV